MRLVETGPAEGLGISRFGSRGIRQVPLHGQEQPEVNLLHFSPGAHLGRHPAVGPQLFVVVAGAGWASGGDGLRRPVTAGSAAFWRAGEEHESGSDEGMTVVIVEAAESDPRSVLGSLLAE